MMTTLSESFDNNGKWLGTKESLENLLGRVACCRYDSGGSHYHCGNCGGTSGYQGHYGKRPGEDWQFNCPESPEISNWEDIDDEAAN